jgi:hypothetical protein
MEYETVESGKVDSTYFTATDVEPDIKQHDDGSEFVRFYKGEGHRRSWGCPQCNNLILIDEPDLLASLTGFSHKYRGGQFYRYFVRNEFGKIERKRWSQLTLEQQQDVMDVYDQKAPAWARTPGTLKTDIARPINSADRENGIGYKALLITHDESGQVVRVQSPLKHTDWQRDEADQWVLQSDAEPSAENTNGVYIAFNAPRARGYAGMLCKVILSGTIVIGETGARGHMARLLEMK